MSDIASDMDRLENAVNKMLMENNQLRAVNAELLAALEGIANNRLSTAMPEDERVYHSYAQGWDVLVITARAALAKSTS